MLMIRLQRVGRRNHAEFRVVVTEHSRAAKSANYIEKLGSYSPHTNTITVDEERVMQWIKKGAQTSHTVHNLLVTKGLIKGAKKNVLPKKTPIVKEGEATESKAEATPADTKEAEASKEAEKQEAAA